MYTLFQSIATNMPTTAYLKLLDYWLIFGMIMPFIVFSVLITWELLDEFYNEKFTSSENMLVTTDGHFVRTISNVKDQQDNASEKSIPNKNPYKRPSDKTILRHAKWILPLITIAFVTVYTAVVVIVYRQI